MKKGFVFFLAAISLCTLSFASYELMIDRYMSPYAGGEDLLTLYRSLEKKEDQWFPPKEEPSKKFLPAVVRFSELTFFWCPLGLLTNTVQHELFGHGYRGRSLENIKYKKVKIQAPFPYGKGGGSTLLYMNQKTRVSELQLVTIAGSESEYILARLLGKKWVQEGEIDARSASLYANAKLGTMGYAILTKKLHEREDYDLSNDITSYLAYLNDLYPSTRLSSSKLERMMYWNLLDPTLVQAYISELYYVLRGKKWKNYMIPLFGGVSFLPSMSTHLAPYGLEFSYDVYFKYQDRVINTYFKKGSYAGVSYRGAGVEWDDVYKGKSFSLGFKAHAFSQPRFDTSYKYFDLLEGKALSAKQRADLELTKVGGALSLITKYCINNTYTHFYSEIGAKTSGYIPGYDLKGGLVARLGISGRF